MALKDGHGGAGWLGWERPRVRREPATLPQAQSKYADGVRQHQFRQFLFFKAWRALKAHANTQGVRLIGDIPIFVSSDSSDVWAHPELVQLDAARQPAALAGVPPDYISTTCQLSGNPSYDSE